LGLPNSFNFVETTKLWDWLTINQSLVAFSLGYDSLTILMFFVVCVVSFCVHVYSTVYMYADPFLSRFLSFLSLFSFFMLLLVSSGNYLVLFIGW
jgi:NADH-quinone oxidoreductase subunit L